MRQGGPFTDFQEYSRKTLPIIFYYIFMKNFYI